MWNREASVKDDKVVQPHTSGPAFGGASDERRAVAWVGKSVVFKGDLISSEDMTIDGRVEGTIDVHDHALTIGPDAHIQADVVARIVTVLGKVAGTITASEKIYICETGSVEGDVLSPRLAMLDGALLRGRVDTGQRSMGQNDQRPRLNVVSSH
jgi:cytoskeletal protein CcmA (bactofilin family)